MAKKFDGIIEAVRYKNGQITLARVYERRGAAFTDRVMLSRKELLERIQGGKLFLIGVRKKLWAGTFEEGRAVKVIDHNGQNLITTHDETDWDELEQVPVF